MFAGLASTIALHAAAQSRSATDRQDRAEAT